MAPQFDHWTTVLRRAIINDESTPSGQRLVSKRKHAIVIRIFVVEDHPVMRRTLCHYLELSDDLDVCGTAASAEDAIEQLEEVDPDVVLVDVALPGRSGLELVDDVRSRTRTPCLVLSGHAERTYVQRALDGGAAGYVLKGRPEEVPEAIRRVVAGGMHVAAPLRHLVTPPAP